MNVACSWYNLGNCWFSCNFLFIRNQEESELFSEVFENQDNLTLNDCEWQGGTSSFQHLGSPLNPIRWSMVCWRRRCLLIWRVQTLRFFSSLCWNGSHPWICEKLWAWSYSIIIGWKGPRFGRRNGRTPSSLRRDCGPMYIFQGWLGCIKTHLMFMSRWLYLPNSFIGGRDGRDSCHPEGETEVFRCGKSI